MFQVLGVAPEGPAAREQVELEVRHRRADGLARKFTADCVAAAAATVGVEVYEGHLWFEYRGRYGEAFDEM